MGTDTIPDDPDGVNGAHIRWTTSDPIPPIETAVDVLALDDSELRDYVRDLQHETGWVRALLHAALSHVQILTAQLDTARRTIHALRCLERSR